MKKRTISKLKSIFGSKKGKRQHSTKCSRSPSPEPAKSPPVVGESFRPIARTPPSTRVGPPPSPPVPTHPVAPVAPEPTRPLSLTPCAVCGRTFVPESLAKHVKICEKMTIKKRKTFDSSRQRREGTDLDQYLPKNFGLPENSPFLEKSPPNTAKTTLKPKTQSVRSAIKKPMAELEKCPHCGRAFGPRAFERHVEWCADKAKILPNAPAHPPQHIADAKQRLNARTQYKAPPVRGRRSSQSRDKSSNSRSASVDSSRGVSPPREYGDYMHRRVRASESASSNDCCEDASPHVPVIRNSRNNNNSGDANVKARQARLARDLSNTRKQSPKSSIQQSNTDPNISTKPQIRPKNLVNAKKQQQLKKLEEMATKYNERQKKINEDNEKPNQKTPKRKDTDKTQRQIPKIASQTNCKEEKSSKKRSVMKASHKNTTEASETVVRDHNSKDASTSKTLLNEKSRKITMTDKKVQIKIKRLKQSTKECSMSLDSLEETSPDQIKNCHSIGINTELLCPSVPCIIYDNTDQTKFSAPTNKVRTHQPSSDKTEPKLELLYKNKTLVSSCDLQSCESLAGNLKDYAVSTKESILNIPSSNEGILLNITKINDTTQRSNRFESTEDNVSTNSNSKVSNNLHDLEDDLNNLSAEHSDNYEPDINNENYDDFLEENNSNDMRRQGSGDTYTKFTENPADLDEFINITDKMISSHNFNQNDLDLEKNIELLHTPKSTSIETLNENTKNEEKTQTSYKNTYSDVFEELKNNFTNLLNEAGDGVNQIVNDYDDKDKKEINDMEHITVYGIKFYEPENQEKRPAKENSSDLTLPLITVTNKPPRKVTCSKKRMQRIYKQHHAYQMLGEQDRTNKKYQTFIVKDNQDDNSDGQSISAEAPPLKLPRIENQRPDEQYDPFVSAARQMKQLMSSESNIPKKLLNSTKDHNRTLPILRPKDTTSSHLRADNTKTMKDTLNKSYQKTPTLHRMKSFGSTNNDNNVNTFGGRSSSFRVNRNDKKSSQKLNTTFTKSSKENISSIEKSNFNRNSSLNRSFSSYTASSYSTPKPKDKIPKIATSMYHSFQRTTIKQPVKLDKIKRDDEKNNFVNLDAILTDDMSSSMTDSNYIDPRLINENDNLPINVHTILNNPDIISSMESLLNTENLPAKFESFSAQNNNYERNGNIETHTKITNKNTNNNSIISKTTPTVDDLSAQYEKIMSSLEQSIASKTSIRDDDSLCEDFDLEEFMTSFDEEINKHKSENKRTCSSTTRVVRLAELSDSNKTNEITSIHSTPKLVKSGSNGLTPVNKSISLTFSNNNMPSENLFPSSVKRSTSLLDSIQRKNTQKIENAKSRNKADQLEQDIMQSLKDFDNFYEPEKHEITSHREIINYNMQVQNGTAKRDSRLRSEKKKRSDIVTNGDNTSNGKQSNDSAYSSLNRISPSKLSICTSRESHGLNSLEQIQAGSESSGKEDVRSISSDEFLAMERSTEHQESTLASNIHTPLKDMDNPIGESRANSVASSRAGEWRVRTPSSSEQQLAPRLSRFCHECGSKFPVDNAKFCIECGVKRLTV